MCSLQCSLHEVIKGEQTRVALDSRVTQQLLEQQQYYDVTDYVIRSEFMQNS